jgi:hypothetical protein
MSPDKTATISQLYSVLNQWLEDILPADAHILCSNRLIIASRDLLGRIQYTDQFETRMALLDAIKTACNLPLHTGFLRRAVLNGVDAVFLPTSWSVRTHLPVESTHYVVTSARPIHRHCLFRRDKLRLRGYTLVWRFLWDTEFHSSRECYGSKDHTHGGGLIGHLLGCPNNT